MVYGGEAWVVRKEEKGVLLRAERVMVRMMCGVKVKDRKSSMKLMSMVGINAIVFNKLVPIALGLISTIYCYRVSLQILPVPLAGFISTLFLNQNLWLKDDLGSGTPRGFLYPLFLAFIYYLLRSSTIPCLLSLILLAFFYPPSVLVASGVLVLRLFS
jgi:hypothetical protein